MKDILEEILAKKRIEVAQAKRQIPLNALQETHKPNIRRSMRKSLQASQSGIIAEFKRKSPSKGWIKTDGEASTIPAAYAQAGAAALSILTDEPYFGGRLDFIRQARPMTDCPILRKDFIIDEYQLHEARIAGADAVLLIAAALSLEECSQLMHKAHELGLEVLLEIHDETKLPYADLHPDMLGVNNRHLGTFHTNVENSFRIAPLLPRDQLLVSESGISTPATVRALREAGYRGFLIGETFMRQPDPAAALHNFIQEVER